MDKPIATEHFVVQYPDRAPLNATLEVGVPYQDPAHPNQWRCHMTLTPMFPSIHPAVGSTSLHALCLALSLGLDLLHSVVEKGGTVTSHGERFPFKAYAFGVAAAQR